MELTRTNRSGGLTTYISRRRGLRPVDRRHAATHAAVRGAPGEVQVVTHNRTHSFDVCREFVEGHCRYDHHLAHRARAVTGHCPEPLATRQPGFALRFFLATIPERSHPFPSRTRKLSSPGPMVLQGRPCGRVGRRRGFEGPLHKSGPSSFVPSIQRSAPKPVATTRWQLSWVVGSARVAQCQEGHRWLRRAPVGVLGPGAQVVRTR